jgi:hypothetical protein
LPTHQSNAIPTPDVPNPWEAASSLGHQAQKRKAHQEAILDNTKMQLYHILGEYQNLSFLSQHSKRVTCNNPPVPTFNWPNNLIDQAREVVHTPCDMSMPPKFSFELRDEAAKRNIAIISKYNFNLRRALKAN